MNRAMLSMMSAVLALLALPLGAEETAAESNPVAMYYREISGKIEYYGNVSHAKWKSGAGWPEIDELDQRVTDMDERLEDTLELLGDSQNWGSLEVGELELYLNGRRLDRETVMEGLRYVVKHAVVDHRGISEIALAKLGDREVFDLILGDIHSADPARQASGIGSLGVIGNRECVAILGELLYDDSIIKIKGIVGGTTKSRIAARGLFRIIDGRNNLLSGMVSREDIEKWRRWWELHKHEYLDEPEVEAPEEEIIVEDFEPIETPAETLIKPVAKPRAEPKQAPATWPYWVVGLLALTLVLYLVNRRK